MAITKFDPTKCVSAFKPLAIVGHTDMCDTPAHLGLKSRFVYVGHCITFNTLDCFGEKNKREQRSVGTITCIGRRAYNDEICVQVTYAVIHGKDRHNEWFRLADCEGFNGELRQRV